MIAVIGEFRMPVENRETARSAMEKVVLASRAETGCMAYNYAEDVLDPGLYRVSELWASSETLAAHFAAPHMQAWQRERAELGLSGRFIKSYDVRDERPL